MDNDYEVIKEVLCIWNGGRENQLVVGQTYKVISESKLTYKIIVDKENIVCLKNRFEDYVES